jgi:hypothetical protein
VTSGTVVGNNQVGGLAGSIYNGTSITKSLASVSVDALSNGGGLVGKTFNTVTITDCFATGDVTVSGAAAGGLIGYMDGNNSSEVTNTYSTGDVSAASNAGGLLGRGDATFTNSFTVSAVTGTGGGFVGLDESGTYVNDWYYNDREDSQPAGITLATSAADFSDSGYDVYVGELIWDFDTIWEMAGEYPTLR